MGASGYHELELINPTQYRMSIVVDSGQSRSFNMLFRISKAALARKGIRISQGVSDVKKISEFPVDTNYYRTLATFLNSVIKEAEKFHKAKGIIVQSSMMTDAFFKRDSKGNWMVHVVLEGDCVDTR